MVCCGASLRFEMCGDDVAGSVDIVLFYGFLPTGFMFWHCITSKQNASQLGTHFEYDKLQGRKKSLQVIVVLYLSQAVSDDDRLVIP